MSMYEVYASGVIDDAPSVARVLRNVLSFLLLVAGGVAIFSFVVSGLLYLFSGGSADRIASAKRAFVFGVAGAAIVLGALVVVFAVTGILSGSA